MEEYSLTLKRGTRSEWFKFSSGNGDERIMNFVRNIYKDRMRRKVSFKRMRSVRLSLCRVSGNPKVLLTASIYNKSVAGAAKDLTESVKPFLV